MKFYAEMINGSVQVLTFPDGRPLVCPFQRKHKESIFEREARRIAEKLEKSVLSDYNDDEIHGRSPAQSSASDAVKTGQALPGHQYKTMIVDMEWSNPMIQALIKSYKDNKNKPVAVPVPVVQNNVRKLPVVTPNLVPAQVAAVAVKPQVAIKQALNPQKTELEKKLIKSEVQVKSQVQQAQVLVQQQVKVAGNALQQVKLSSKAENELAFQQSSKDAQEQANSSNAKNANNATAPVEKPLEKPVEQKPKSEDEATKLSTKSLAMSHLINAANDLLKRESAPDSTISSAEIVVIPQTSNSMLTSFNAASNAYNVKGSITQEVNQAVLVEVQAEEDFELLDKSPEKSPTHATSIKQLA